MVDTPKTASKILDTILTKVIQLRSRGESINWSDNPNENGCFAVLDKVCQQHVALLVHSNIDFCQIYKSVNLLLESEKSTIFSYFFLKIKFISKFYADTELIHMKNM